jgi:hypothetical protein
MVAIRYIIHGLIDVLVDSHVNDSVIEQIDFQIGYFRVVGKQQSAPYQIVVKSYDEFFVDPALTFDTFHLVRGIRCEIVDDPKNRRAIKKEHNTYIIFADTPFLINLYIQLLLIEQGIALVHAAAVADGDGRVILFPGAGGVGKTSILGYLVKQGNYRILGDDIVGISKKGECLSFPRSFVLKEYHRAVYPETFHRLDIKKNKQTLSWTGLLRFVRDNAPFIGVTKHLLRRLGILDKAAVLVPPPEPFLAAVPVEEIFGSGSVADHGNINHVIFLQRYSGEQFRGATEDHKLISQRMLAIIQHEWVSVMREFFTLGAMEIVDIAAYFHSAATIMESAILGSRCEMFWIPDNASPDELGQYVSHHLGF